MNNNTTILGFAHKGTGVFVTKDEAYAQYGHRAFNHDVPELRPLYHLDEVQAAQAKARELLSQVVRHPVA
jgi:hypothetical protein